MVVQLLKKCQTSDVNFYFEVCFKIPFILRNLIENLVLQSGSISRDSLIGAYVKVIMNTRITSLLANTFKMDEVKLP